MRFLKKSSWCLRLANVFELCVSVVSKGISPLCLVPVVEFSQVFYAVVMPADSARTNHVLSQRGINAVNTSPHVPRSDISLLSTGGSRLVLRNVFRLTGSYVRSVYCERTCGPRWPCTRRCSRRGEIERVLISGKRLVHEARNAQFILFWIVFNQVINVFDDRTMTQGTPTVRMHTIYRRLQKPSILCECVIALARDIPDGHYVGKWTCFHQGMSETQEGSCCYTASRRAGSDRHILVLF